MKNNESTQITQARQGRESKIAVVDLNDSQATIVPRVVGASLPQRRRRRIDYVKKIINDPFILAA